MHGRGWQGCSMLRARLWLCCPKIPKPYMMLRQARQRMAQVGL